jgi:DNA polymerase III alpha subunit (gram-positive type)
MQRGDFSTLSEGVYTIFGAYVIPMPGVDETRQMLEDDRPIHQATFLGCAISVQGLLHGRPNGFVIARFIGKPAINQ